ncbi:GntR family transcriptional regulator [Azospirillum doebereinerae]|uniref:GntR family transcriptional regulator n=1 Tax=Azospirillum doebereinerae TaxID=92933 RepID=UPI001EE55DF1|nr:GntR family transcriptional regulator [Azospirillum doebereinerae]MCG5241537.1 GntR family transcriptional regulator [Azospirillum doebereinerae]
MEAPANGSAPVRRRVPKPASASRERGITAAQQVYQQLRAEIVGLRRKPGEPLSEKELAQAHGISRTPVREAMLKLAAERLVEVFPQSGTFVARIPLSDLPQSIIIRSALEEASVRHAAERATPDQIARLTAIIDRQRVVTAAGDREGFHVTDEEFHAGLSDAAGLPGIWTLIQQVKVQIDRYRRLTLPEPGRMERVVEEHAAVVAAIAAHDPEAAARAIRHHLGNLRDGIDAFRIGEPDWFIDDRGAPPAS